MKIPTEEAERIVYGDHEDWEEVPGSEEIVDQSRWATTLSKVFLHKPSGKRYSTYYDHGSTEQQDSTELFQDDPVDFCEVELKEVTKKEWVPVEPA